MNKTFKIGLIGLSLLFFCCDKNNKANSLKIGEVNEIKSGKTVENSQYNLSLQVEDVNDSRCPIGARCFWEGTATVKFHLITPNGHYYFTLNTHRHPNFINDTTIEGIKYELVDVLPYPDDSKRQRKQTVKVFVGE